MEVTVVSFCHWFLKELLRSRFQVDPPADLLHSENVDRTITFTETYFALETTLITLVILHIKFHP